MSESTEEKKLTPASEGFPFRYRSKPYQSGVACPDCGREMGICHVTNQGIQACCEGDGTHPYVFVTYQGKISKAPSR